MNRKALSLAGFAAIAAAFLAYALHFVFSSGFTVDGIRYYALFDDGMISMRYAANLAHGLGLVYNAGERVEGFTNPLWTGYMALVHAAGVPPPKTSLVIQLTSVAVLVANLFQVRRLALALGGSDRAANAAAFLTAFFFSLNFWSLFGMEVGLVTLLVTASLARAVEDLQRGRRSWVPHLLLGAGMLVRIDVVVPYLAVAGALWLLDREGRRFYVLAGLGTLAVFLGSQTLLRYFYYGDALPNTYYLKMADCPLLFRAKRGLVVLAAYLWATNWALWIVPAAALLRAPRTWWLAAAVVAGELAYSAYVGGDAWEFWDFANRFISQVMPVVFVLLALVVAELAEHLGAGLRWPRFRPAFAGMAFWGATFAILCSFNVVIYGGPSKYAVQQFFRSGRCDRVYFNQVAVEYARVLERVAKREATVLIYKAGTTPYFLDRRIIDGLGKCDRRIAHGPTRFETGFRPGHSKWDYNYSIGVLKPDIVAEIWPAGEPEARPWLDKYYRRVRAGNFEFHVLDGSPHVDLPALGGITRRAGGS